jgi:hypothetical protein
MAALCDAPSISGRLCASTSAYLHTRDDANKAGRCQMRALRAEQHSACGATHSLSSKLVMASSPRCRTASRSYATAASTSLSNRPRYLAQAHAGQRTAASRAARMARSAAHRYLRPVIWPAKQGFAVQ